MPVFSVAAFWTSRARPEDAASALEEMARLGEGSSPPEIVVALIEGQASVEVRLELRQYPRARLEEIAARIEKGGGTFVDLWRVPKAERDLLRARALPPSLARAMEAGEAARAIARHLLAIAGAGGAPEAPREPVQTMLARLRLEKRAASRRDASASPAQERGGRELRNARRYDVSLELSFRTDADFVREHATNISRGGLFIRTPRRPPLDSVAFVDVLLPTGDRIQGAAMVVHVREGPDGGVGLAFLTEDLEFAAALDRYLARLSGPEG